jgi:Zn finger protein HypA/HybF involved in hydrogenase expression
MLMTSMVGERAAEIGRLRSATMPDDAVQTVLHCQECGRPWLEGERGWEAHRVDLDEVAFYCPECAEREFGQGENVD